jgi:predicted TIM-barrel fold metal-dependent hydrolase
VAAGPVKTPQAGETSAPGALCRGPVLEDFEPRSELVIRRTSVTAPRFPVVDAHSHLGSEFGGGWDERSVRKLLDVLDEARVDCLVDLDGGWGEGILNRHLASFKEVAPDRFACFGGVDWSAWADHGSRFPEWAAARLETQVRRGAEGLKIWKPFGLRVTDERGERVPVDDSRLDPVWVMAGQLGIPVMIHVADPVAFFRPLDRHNELYLVLRQHPDWHAADDALPSFGTIIGEMASLVERHAQTVFIGAHVGCYVENLAWVGRLLDRCPNFHVDIAHRLDYLSRQPHTARQFFLTYRDRILFGTDRPADVAMYRRHYEFLETSNEDMPSPYGSHPGESWPLLGLHLPDDVLRRVYGGNAARLLGTGRPEGLTPSAQCRP